MATEARQPAAAQADRAPRAAARVAAPAHRALLTAARAVARAATRAAQAAARAVRAARVAARAARDLNLRADPAAKAQVHEYHVLDAALQVGAAARADR